jgi:hypothetical protein
MPIICIDISVMQLTVTPFVLAICEWSRIQTFDRSVQAVQDYKMIGQTVATTKCILLRYMFWSHKDHHQAIPIHEYNSH